MTPGSFDPATAKEWVGDARVRVIESQARADAEIGTDAYKPPRLRSATTYAGQVAEDMIDAVYHAAFQSRLDRNARILVQLIADRIDADVLAKIKSEQVEKLRKKIENKQSCANYAVNA